MAVAEYDQGRFETHLQLARERLDKVELRAAQAEDRAENAGTLGWMAIGFCLIFTVFHVIELVVLFQIAARFGAVLP